MTDLSKMKSNALSLDEFALAIRGSWNKAIESIIETAKMVKRAEDELERKDLNALKKHLEQERIMSGPTFSKLAKIAANPVLTAPENIPRLPHSYATLYELTHHDTTIVQDALKDGKIHAAIKHREISDILPKRAPNRLIKKSAKSKISVSIRFTAEEGEVPDELLQRLRDLLTEIDGYVDIKQSGIDT